MTKKGKNQDNWKERKRWPAGTRWHHHLGTLDLMPSIHQPVKTCPFLSPPFTETCKPTDLVPMTGPQWCPCLKVPSLFKLSFL